MCAYSTDQASKSLPQHFNGNSNTRGEIYFQFSLGVWCARSPPLLCLLQEREMKIFIVHHIRSFCLFHLTDNGKKTNNSCQKLASKPQCFRRWFFNAGSQARKPGLKINQESAIIKCGNFTGAKSCWFFYLPSNLSTFLPAPDPPPQPPSPLWIPHDWSPINRVGSTTVHLNSNCCLSRGLHSTEEAFLLPTQQPGFKSGSGMIFSLSA